MPIAWIGDKGSMLRARAVVSGWTPAVLPDMITKFWMKHVSAWTRAMDYPYSLCIAIKAAAALKMSQVAETDLSPSLVVHTHIGLPRLGKSQFRPKPPDELWFNGCALDLALAQIILERVPMPEFVLKMYPHAAALSGHERAALETMVDMHMSLDCMNLLVEALARDTIPGENAKIEFGIELPELDSAVR